ncbi:hypothetical protein [Methanocella sp. MCL-LM]|uniref:hypothetical protein n=1 Tax=Methanocella sp. MCL-LM TaxID=3412035 RepID=UPI003C7369CC
MFPYYEYNINVSGLENFTTDDGSAVIMLPAPAVDGRVILPFGGKFNGSLYKNIGDGGFDVNIVGINGWGYHGTRYVEVVNTSHGQMIEARFDSTDFYKVWPSRSGDHLTNMTLDEYGMYTINKTEPAFDDLIFRSRMVLGPKDNETTNATVASLANRPLHPIANTSSAGYTISAKIPYVENYTSYIYLDERLKPVSPGNHTIEIYARMEIAVGVHPYGGSQGNHYVFVIRESIPEGVTGYVPVTVQYIGNANVRPEELF